MTNTSDNSLNSYSANDILNFLIETGNLTLSDVKNAMKEANLKEILKNHPYSIYQGSDGRWYTYVADDTKKNCRRKIVKSEEKQLHIALYEYYKGVEEKSSLCQMTLRSLYPLWLKYKALHTTAETYITRIASDWKKYYLSSSIIDIPIISINKLILDEWLHSLIKEYSMSKNQYYNATVIIRQALNYAVDLGIITANPINNVTIDGKRLFRKVKKKADETQVYTKDELSEVKRLAWEDFENRVKVYELAPLALMFQFQTGLRISEVCVVEYDDIENNDYLHIHSMLRRDTKEVIQHTKGTYGDRYVFLTKEAKEIIRQARNRQSELDINSPKYIFSLTDTPLSIRAVSDLYTKYCKKLGIIQKSSHKSRKTYISSLIDGNVNINTIRSMVGHSSEKTTYGNYCFDRSTESERAMKIEQALW